MRGFYQMSLATLALGVGLGAAAAMAEVQDLEGSVSYRERMALPPGALVVVQLLDVSIADAKSQVLGSVTLAPDGQVPVSYRLSYDDAMITPQGRYAVQATIEHQGHVLFRTTQNFAALTNDAPQSVHVNLQKMPPPKALELAGTGWQVVRINDAWMRDEALPTLAFEAEGRVAGSGGCNQFQGTYELTPAGLVFGPMASTRMACGDPVGQRETDFFTALGGVAKAEMDDGLLLLKDIQGRAVLTLMAK